MIISSYQIFRFKKYTNAQKITVVCDVCKKEYITHLGNQQNSFKIYDKDLCRSCKTKDMYKTGVRTSASTWSSYNKLQKNKTLEERIGKEKAQKAKEKMSKAHSGENNNNFNGAWRGIHPSINQKGKTFEEIWGKEKAKKIKQKISKSTSGINNPMYGKPSPSGSGNGWSGWYNGWYFRSLKELSYMIYVIERFNLKWESAEKAKYKIEYTDRSGEKRTYHPDFLINDKYLIEIKPKKLWNSDNVKRKKAAAEQFCNNHNFKYKLTESPKLIQYQEIKKLIETKKLVFIKRYQEKWQNL